MSESDPSSTEQYAIVLTVAPTSEATVRLSSNDAKLAFDVDDSAMRD